ncbi:MAG TPA: hypothetical protein VLT59_11210, partial [Steroidobacteraceae bacterium]|nr:hypothetical protein [Steroidobacteraceae bacterium]
MAKRRAEDLIHTNEEYEKLKSETGIDRAPRETPAQQAPGQRGLDRPELEAWTDEELRTATRALGVEDADMLDRDAL